MFNVLAGKFTGTAGVVVYIILYFLFVLGYTVMSVGGGTSISTILTNDPKQRPFVQFISMIYQYIGPLGVNNILNLVVLPRYNNQIDAVYLREACFWYCGYALIFTTLSLIGLKNVDTPEMLGKLMSDSSGRQKSIKVRDMVNMVKGNKPLRCYMVAGITDKIASNTNSQAIITTLLNGILIGSYQTANTISNYTTLIGFIFAFIGGAYLAKWGVKKATKTMSTICILINTLVGAACIVLGPSGMSRIGTGGLVMYLYLVMMMGRSAATMCLNIAEGMMRADVIDYELYRSGNFMPGMVGAVYSFTEKIVASFGATIASIAVAAIGYTTVMPQLGDEATWAILWVVEIIVFGLPILGWLANIIAMHFYELDKERMAEIQMEIAEKKKTAKQAMKK